MSGIRETTESDPQVKPVPDELLQEGLPPRPFWQRFLQWGHSILSAEAAILWELPPDSPKLVPEGMYGNAKLRGPVLQRDDGQVSHVLQAAATDEIVTVRAHSRANESLADCLFIAVPVHTREDLFGVLEFILPAGTTEKSLEKLLLLLLQSLQKAQRVFCQPAETSQQDEDRFWQEFEPFCYAIHRSLVISEVTDVAVNDGRQLLQCDRLSLAVVRGKSNRITAISGQDEVNRRSQDVRCLETIAADAIAAKEVLKFHADHCDLTPRLLEKFSRYIELSAAKLIMAIPLYTPARQRSDEEHDLRQEPDRRVVGCLLIENFQQGRLAANRASRIPILADTTGSAVANALAQQQILLLSTRRVLGRSLNWFRGRTLAKTLLVLSSVLLTALVLTQVPHEYRVEARGQLMPAVQRRLFAPWDGVVVTVSVTNGQRVAQGDELLKIYNDDLHAELVAAENELSEKRQQLLAISTEIGNAARSSVERATEIRLKGQQQEVRLEIAGLQKKLAILRKREVSLRLTTPIDGVVATFRLEEKLRDRPVSRGEFLVEVMDDTSEWMLELHMPEHRMGHLLRAAQSSDEGILPVEYVLATDVATTFTGRLDTGEIASRSEMDDEFGTIVRMRAMTDKNQLPVLRIGAEATAKVACGRRSLGYVLFGDVWEFILRHVWI